VPERIAAPSFAEYLEAKFELDSASLAPAVLDAFRARLRRLPSPRILDVGTGTGAMLRRLAAMGLRGEPLLVGMDRDAATLAAGKSVVARALRRDRWAVRTLSSVRGGFCTRR